VLHWVVPFASRNMRMHPFFTVVSFAFHACLLVTPLFVMGHAVLWEESWGISWWSLPPLLADLMTLVVVFGGLFFLLRRLASPEVRNVSAWSDFGLVLLVISPFATGFLAHHQILPYRPMVTAHIVCGVLWLIAVPFTRLSHAIFFLFTRSFMGSEFGAVRNAKDW
jgi:nitrate reductase gamma subunit